MKKTFAFILCLLFLVPLLASCMDMSIDVQIHPKNGGTIVHCIEMEESTYDMLISQSDHPFEEENIDIETFVENDVSYVRLSQRTDFDNYQALADELAYNGRKNSDGETSYPFTELKISTTEDEGHSIHGLVAPMESTEADYYNSYIIEFTLPGKISQCSENVLRLDDYSIRLDILQLSLSHSRNREFTVTSEPPSYLWLVLLIVGGSILLFAIAILVIVLLINRNKKKNSPPLLMPQAVHGEQPHNVSPLPIADRTVHTPTKTDVQAAPRQFTKPLTPTVTKFNSAEKEQIIHELKLLKELYDAGILTEEEFNNKKKKLVDLL